MELKIGQKLSLVEFALYRAVDEVLHYVWDPIGVSGVPQARDEYRSYLPQVFELVRCGSDENPIARYLNEIATERLGLTESAENDLAVGRHLLEWKESFMISPPNTLFQPTTFGSG